MTSMESPEKELVNHHELMKAPIYQCVGSFFLIIVVGMVGLEAKRLGAVFFYVSSEKFLIVFLIRLYKIYL